DPTSKEGDSPQGPGGAARPPIPICRQSRRHGGKSEPAEPRGKRGAVLELSSASFQLSALEPTARKRRIAEISAAAATGALHPLFIDVFHEKALFIAVAGIGWLVYFVYRVRQDWSVLRSWGFREKNLAPASIAGLAVLVGGLLTLLLLSSEEGRVLLVPHMVPLLLL